MAARDHDVTLPDGRILQVSETGDLTGKPVFMLHGQPGARLQFAAHVEDARKRGIRLIGHSRPGYGGSTRRPGRSVADAARDVQALADALGIDRFAVWGISGGGPPALACAALLPRRVVAVASLAAVAPYPADGIDWFAGMGDYNVEDFKLMMSDRAAWEAKSIREAEEMRASGPAQLIEMLSTLLSEVDRRALSDEFVEFMLAQGNDGLSRGVWGSVDDCLSLVIPWGFDFASTGRVPLQYWHGQQDKFCPFSHGQWLAARLPRAELHLEPNEGHLSLWTGKIPTVHAWLVTHF